MRAAWGCARRSRFGPFVGGHVTAVRRDPRAVAAVALAELDVEIDVRRAELEVLERCRAVLGRARDVDTCDLATDDSPCSGPIWARWCRACITVVRRCLAHGGLDAAAGALAAHSLGHGAAARPPGATTAPRRARRMQTKGTEP